MIIVVIVREKGYLNNNHDDNNKSIPLIGERERERERVRWRESGGSNDPCGIAGLATSGIAKPCVFIWIFGISGMRIKETLCFHWDFWEFWDFLPPENNTPGTSESSEP